LDDKREPCRLGRTAPYGVLLLRFLAARDGHGDAAHARCRAALLFVVNDDRRALG
jgi:hypothetical protein